LFDSVAMILVIKFGEQHAELVFNRTTDLRFIL